MRPGDREDRCGPAGPGVESGLTGLRVTYSRIVAGAAGRHAAYARGMNRNHALAAAALLVPGLLAGCSSLGSANPTPGETTTVTVTATPTEAALSQECNAALDQADAAVGADSALMQDVPQAITAMQQAAAAATRMDLNGVAEQTRVLEQIDLQTKATAAQQAATEYQQAVDKCRQLRN